MASPQPPRQRVGPVRLAFRWLGVLAVTALVGWSAVTALTEYFGGDDGAQAGSADGVGGTGEPVGSSPSTDSVVPTNSDSAPDTTPEGGPDTALDTTPDTDASPTTTLPERSGPPTPENPARVYIVGDSDAGTFGPYLQQLLDGTLIATTELNYKVSSGLSRPDFFDWPAELRATLPAVKPDIVVVTFGGNDAQGLAKSQPETEFIIGDPVANEAEWTVEYERRAGEVMDLLLEDGRAVIWVGIPNDDNPEVTARMAIQDRAAKAAAAARPGVVFIDTWKRFSGRDGGWAEFVIDPRDGQGKDVRAADGFHLNTTGAEILALDIAQAVRDELRARGGAI